MYRIRRTTLVKVAAGTIVGAALAAAGIVWVAWRSDDDPGHEQGPLFAYITNTRLRLMHGTQQLGAYDADFAFPAESAERVMSVQFTTDNRFAFAVAQRETDAFVVSIAVSDGTAKTIPCQCSTVVPVGGSDVAWLDEHNLRHVVNVGNGEATREPAPVEGKNQYTDPSLLTGGAGFVLIAHKQARDADLDHVEHHTLIGADGAIKDAGTSVWAVRSATSVKADRIAVVADWTDNICAAEQSVSLIDTATGIRTSTEFTALGTRRFRQYDGRFIDDVWWTSDGDLYATVRTYVCRQLPDSNDIDFTTVVPPSLWHLEGTTWSPVADNDGQVMRQLGPSSSLHLRDDADHQEDPVGGTLTLRTGNRASQVDDHAAAFAAPAYHAIPGRPSRKRPNLGIPPCKRDALPIGQRKANVSTLACHGVLAYGVLQGEDVGALGSQSILWVARAGTWQELASGTATDGQISACDLQDVNVDPAEVAEEIPEWGGSTVCI
ncbi:hypothetical protein OHA72_22670 [Dactylosporangium sp. NBC_01737]|uniref:hypothetical protein n=1 Tax=Dactylosporangium sp. NBC_01737 TaxID=2975959 RepID=UPI002E0DD50E|nr:hypothetical protein OHA72_22670 [Dactylosporangium sp. NBC_01737]